MNKTVTISENQWEIATNHAFELSELRERYKARGVQIKDIMGENVALRENIDNLKQEMNEYTTAYAREIHLLKQELERYKVLIGAINMCVDSPFNNKTKVNDIVAMIKQFSEGK